MKRKISLICLLLIVVTTFAQRSIESSSDIFQEIKKLNVISHVLYIAAHPDDENTSLIAWLENEKLARTAYLSLTRGDGGQNIIGSEKGEAMGVLRTQELLKARKIDGGEQFFSEADDFGYSKSAEETFEKWDKQKILSNVVYIIRKFRPDIIITRFPPDSRGGHGHHTASSILAEEAFHLAADKNAFPEQLSSLNPWQAKRILWNTSIWWDNQLPEKAAQTEDYIKVNVGDYNELLGLSYSEIAADSRSQHKSQGFGSSRSRGNRLEYLKHTDGEQAKNDLFEGINTSWERLEGGKAIQSSIEQIIEKYNIHQPAASVNSLVELYNEMKQLKDRFYVEEKLQDLRTIIKAAAGIHVEVLVNDYNYVSGDQVKGTFSIINRSEIPVQLISIQPKVEANLKLIKLDFNENLSLPFSFQTNHSISHPHWLPYNKTKEDLLLPFNESPENSVIEVFKYTLSINGITINFSEPIDYKCTDRVDGELHRNVIISPLVTVTPSKKVVVFSKNEAQNVTVLVESNKAGESNRIEIKVPKGWKVNPTFIEFDLKNKGEQKSVSFQLTPPFQPSVGEITFTLKDKKAKAVQHINYPHIPPQIMFPTATAKVVKMDLHKTVKNIGYVKGSGDEVAENLRQVGFNVVSLEANNLALIDLSRFETIIVGIRAYNTKPAMKNANAILNKFVKKGGTVIVQYNTSRGIEPGEIGPYPFRLSRNRVTKEEAEPTFLNPYHPILNTPNKLSKKDFEGWVQERGLYFADIWDDKYDPIIAWNDPGEEPQKGSILVGNYGEGHFIFTGISFFRQLPAGVPGAYRLLTNMISYGK